MKAIDLNCDLGEGAGQDAALMPMISSANIACGAHAGDAATMRETVALARRHAVGIGAHPGYADRASFGRRERDLAPREIGRLVTEQVMALGELTLVRHVKLHGALYNLAARDRTVADAVAAAVHAIDPTLIIFGLAGSRLIEAARARSLSVAEEAFADRTYRPDGMLTPREQPDALIHDEEKMIAQVLGIVERGVVRASDGSEIPLRADTICLHGDGESAALFARRLRRELAAASIVVRAVPASSIAWASPGRDRETSRGSRALDRKSDLESPS